MAVDWSGSVSGGGSQIWLAAVEEGRLVEFRGRLTRDAIVDTLIEWKALGIGMVVGLDFAFSMPAWFVAEHGCRSAPEFWAVVEREGEGWLAACPAPFWGRPGRPRTPALQYRATELGLAAQPKSAFQVGGAGAVGTGSIRGMPLLARLHAAGFAVWPFDEPGPATLIEIYPRLLTGPGPKRQAGWRRAYLESIEWPADVEERALAGSTEDSFDASVSALRMWQLRDQLEALVPAGEALPLLEGAIWAPASPQASPAFSPNSASGRAHRWQPGTRSVAPVGPGLGLRDG